MGGDRPDSCCSCPPGSPGLSPELHPLTLASWCSASQVADPGNPKPSIPVEVPRFLALRPLGVPAGPRSPSPSLPTQGSCRLLSGDWQGKWQIPYSVQHLAHSTDSKGQSGYAQPARREARGTAGGAKPPHRTAGAQALQAPIWRGATRAHLPQEALPDCHALQNTTFCWKPAWSSTLQMFWLFLCTTVLLKGDFKPGQNPLEQGPQV